MLGIRRWRRARAATAVACALIGTAALTGCSGSGHATATPSTPTTAVTTAADPTLTAATRAAGTALALTRRLRAYSFDSVQTLSGGQQPQRTELRGRAIRPASITYDLIVGGKTQQVIRLGGRSYLRVPPATWKLLAKPGPSVDPLTSLIGLLGHFTPQSRNGHTLRGTVAGSVLVASGLAPAGSRSAAMTPVSFTLDATGHVTGLALVLELRAGTLTLHLTETVRYGAFNRVAPIRAPGKVRPA